jgi:hypothetical protein
MFAVAGLMDGGNGTHGFLRGALTLHNSRGAPEKIFIQVDTFSPNLSGPALA